MDNSTPTIHNAAKKGEIAKTILMPGDPLRAKYIAEEYLENAKLLSSIRNIYVYTGSYDNREVSVMASGMGASSMGIYSYELFNCYDVDAIIRVGSAGGLHSSLELGDVVVGVSCSTDSSYPMQYNLPGQLTLSADFNLASKAMEYAEDKGINALAGPIFSGEAFYYSNEFFERWAKMGMLAVEMESAALYSNAAFAQKKALVLCTIADMVFTGEACTTQEREKTFDNMIKMALSLVE